MWREGTVKKGPEKGRPGGDAPSKTAGEMEE